MVDSGYGEKSKRNSLDKENYSPNKKVRKSLASSWMRTGLDDSLTAPETPSKSLVGTNDASILFSPPQILKETFADDSGAGGIDVLGAVGPSDFKTEEASPSKSKASRHLMEDFQH